MAGRLDYEERKERKIERYEELSEKAKKKSKEYSSAHDKIAKNIPFGQPILVDHYSASRHRSDIKKMHRAMDGSIKEDEKAKHYEDKISSIENNTAISSDDPKAIEKLEKKLKGLEEYKTKVKARKHESWELQNLNQQIRNVKERIAKIKELDEIEFEDITFNGGKVVHNKEINRIQILFDDIPDEDTRALLKSRAFKWSRYEKAWQRLFNKSAIYAVNRLIKEGVLEVQKNEKMSEMWRTTRRKTSIK